MFSQGKEGKYSPKTDLYVQSLPVNTSDSGDQFEPA